MNEKTEFFSEIYDQLLEDIEETFLDKLEEACLDSLENTQDGEADETN